MRTFAIASVLIAVVSAGVQVERALARQAPPAAPQAQAGGNQAAPSLPVDEIIRKFAAREKEFKLARDNYTYRQTVKVQDLTDGGGVRGEYRIDADIIFTPSHKRIERVTYAPQSTLRSFSISPEDDRDLRDIQPFVLTSDDIDKYNIRYLGRQRVDEVDTYVFSVSPKTIEKGQRYFEGQIWVDDRDLQIVKSYGKAVPDIRGKGGSENLFPRFETYREQIDGKYWFPTYTRAEDTLHFSSGPVRMRMIVTYKDYKYFGAESTIKYEGVTDQPEQKAPPKKP